MLTIDKDLIGRKYTTSSPNTVYTLRGMYAQPNGKPIVIGECSSAPNTLGAHHFLVTHKLEEIKLESV